MVVVLMTKGIKLIFTEKPVQNIVVDNIKTIYSISSSKNPKHNVIYNVCWIHIPGNRDIKYIIVDKDNLIDNLGEKEIVFMRLSHSDIVRLPESSTWYKQDMQVYKAEYSLSVVEFFKSLKTGKSTWREDILPLWLYEGCKKDERVINAFKSSVVWIEGTHNLIQPLNGNQIWLGNTGIGKSGINMIIGKFATVDVSAAGLLGGNIDDYKGQIKGVLNGSGWPVIIDEIQSMLRGDEPIIPPLLTYLEQGEGQRSLKVPVVCRGTKAVILASNPSDNNDMLMSFNDFVKVVCGTEHPSRVGRRFAFFLVGSDYLPVDDKYAITKYRGILKRVVEYSIHLYQKKIRSILNAQMKWVKTADANKKKLEEDIAKKIPNEFVKQFVEGHILAQRRIKTCAIKFLMLEYLDMIVLEKGYKSVNNIIDKNKEEVFERLFNLNIDSLKKISYFYDTIEKTPECAKRIKEKYPNLSFREIGMILDVSHQTVFRWLSPPSENDNVTMVQG